MHCLLRYSRFFLSVSVVVFLCVCASRAISRVCVCVVCVCVCFQCMAWPRTYPKVACDVLTAFACRVLLIWCQLVLHLSDVLTLVVLPPILGAVFRCEVGTSHFAACEAGEGARLTEESRDAGHRWHIPPPFPPQCIPPPFGCVACFTIRH